MGVDIPKQKFQTEQTYNKKTNILQPIRVWNPTAAWQASPWPVWCCQILGDFHQTLEFQAFLAAAILPLFLPNKNPGPLCWFINTTISPDFCSNQIHCWNQSFRKNQMFQAGVTHQSCITDACRALYVYEIAEKLPQQHFESLTWQCRTFRLIINRSLMFIACYICS